MEYSSAEDTVFQLGHVQTSLPRGDVTFDSAPTCLVFVEDAASKMGRQDAKKFLLMGFSNDKAVFTIRCRVCTGRRSFRQCEGLRLVKQGRKSNRVVTRLYQTTPCQSSAYAHDRSQLTYGITFSVGSTFQSLAALGFLSLAGVGRIEGEW